MKFVIKSLRVGLGYKAGEFAERIGISREYLRLIENGKAKNPSVKIMKRISEELGATVQELFFL
ncbi:helix-turn-helix transcriptional regulator [Clostridium beijerinckii]|uniref:Transcriptional regulator n=1 Tax=Clostridium beijerinckii TaxID=1520 RepID=A0AAX0BAN2_CLOBE|nr:helix-turn-helix transcriptional regulator [Clostridium beijerinckii]NRT92254.1 putative transcriptional regulator [Clostridium beijerinckii]NYC75603.1 putative transcriptional regulator [Clostridium beijerinckii]